MSKQDDAEVSTAELSYDGNFAEKGGKKEDQGVRSAGIAGTSVNIINTVIGAGILGMPIAVAQTGWVIGMIMFVISYFVTQIGLYFIVLSADAIGGDQTSFGVAAKRSNPVLPLMADFAVWFICFFIAVLYLTTAAGFTSVSLKSMIDDATGDEIYLQNWFWSLLIWVVVAIPLSVPKKIGILQYTSFIAILCVLYTVVIVIYMYFQDVHTQCETYLINMVNGTMEAPEGGFKCAESITIDPANFANDTHVNTDGLPTNPFIAINEYCCFDAKAWINGNCCLGPIEAARWDPLAWLAVFPNICTAFCCAPQMFNLYNDFINPTTKRFFTAVVGGLSVCMTLYVFLSIFAYFTYGRLISDDVLGSYPHTTPVTIARLGLAFVVSVSYPLLMHPARDAMISMISTFIPSLKNPEGKTQSIVYYAVLAVNLIMTFVFSLFAFPFGLVLGIGSSFSVVHLSFTFPGLFYLLIIKEKSFVLVACAWVMIVLGVSLMLINASMLMGLIEYTWDGNSPGSSYYKEQTFSPIDQWKALQ